MYRQSPRRLDYLHAPPCATHVICVTAATKATTATRNAPLPDILYVVVVGRKECGRKQRRLPNFCANFPLSPTTNIQVAAPSAPPATSGLKEEPQERPSAFTRQKRRKTVQCPAPSSTQPSMPPHPACAHDSVRAPVSTTPGPVSTKFSCGTRACVPP